jgi:DNA-binding MarR family transcriptional regulator
MTPAKRGGPNSEVLRPTQSQLAWMVPLPSRTSVTTQESLLSNVAAATRSAMRRLSTEVDGLDQRAAQHFNVSRTDIHLIDTLESGGQMTASELARAVGLTSGGLSIALERLERLGYIRRLIHPRDRRKVVVEVTDAIAPLQEEMFGSLGRRTQALLNGYSDHQLATIVDYLERVATIIGESGRPRTSKRSTPSRR